MSKGRQQAFTLIEVLVVMAIVAMLLSLVTPRYFASIERSRETTLRHDLAVMRDAIDKYYSDKNRYPNSLEELVHGQYLRAIPEDPMTESAETWIATPPPDPNALGVVYDVHSGATGQAADGSSYMLW
ncbi:Type II secretion system protein G [uncultured bacterium]|nr:Type II secretion system protein G [uncultured bacterium]